MSRTKIHIIEGKCKNGVMEYKNAPINAIRKWDRHNFEVGYFRNLRNELKSKINLQNELK